MYNWIITIEAWPHSTNRGHSIDQKEAGERVQKFAVRAIDIKDALEKAELIAQGMRTNPMCWRAPIFSITMEKD